MKYVLHKNSPKIAAQTKLISKNNDFEYWILAIFGKPSTINCQWINVYNFLLSCLQLHHCTAVHRGHARLQSKELGLYYICL